VNCNNCTLQVIQFMYDKGGNGQDDEYYFQCADIVLEGAMGGAGGAGAGGSASGGADGMGGSPAGVGGMVATSGGSGVGGMTSDMSMVGTAGAAGGAVAAAGTTGTPITPVQNGSGASDPGGCGLGSNSERAPTGLALLAALFGLSLLRRRRFSRRRF
jgi:hypothetical protein